MVSCVVLVLTDYCNFQRRPECSIVRSCDKRSRVSSHGREQGGSRIMIAAILSHIVDYKVMQKQSKHFSFRKTIRGVFSHSEKSDQYVCERQHVSILLSLAKSDFHRFSRWRRSCLIGFDGWWKGCRNGCYRDFPRCPANGKCFSHQRSLHCSGRRPHHTGTQDAKCTFPTTLLIYVSGINHPLK